MLVKVAPFCWSINVIKHVWSASNKTSNVCVCVCVCMCVCVCVCMCVFCVLAGRSRPGKGGGGGGGGETVVMVSPMLNPCFKTHVAMLTPSFDATIIIGDGSNGMMDWILQLYIFNCPSPVTI